MEKKHETTTQRAKTSSCGVMSGGNSFLSEVSSVQAMRTN